MNFQPIRPVNSERSGTQSLQGLRAAFLVIWAERTLFVGCPIRHGAIPYTQRSVCMGSRSDSFGFFRRIRYKCHALILPKTLPRF